MTEFQRPSLTRRVMTRHILLGAAAGMLAPPFQITGERVSPLDMRTKELP